MAVLTRTGHVPGQVTGEIIWIIGLLLIVAVVGFAALSANRLHRRFAVRVADLEAAAGHTLALVEGVVLKIEQSRLGMPPNLRDEYDAALALRDRSRRELDQQSTTQGLGQANRDAAQAMLSLQRLMRKLELASLPPTPGELGEERCFYCGRAGRPPYQSHRIDDGSGNSLEIEICARCWEQLRAGKTPLIAAIRYAGSPVPWWAMPESRWYETYGGPAWQYWLPLAIGVSVVEWFAGDWASRGLEQATAED